MEKNLLLNDLKKKVCTAVYNHIKHDCDPDDYDNGWCHRGLIVADDETGEMLDFVKEAVDNRYSAIIHLCFCYN